MIRRTNSAPIGFRTVPRTGVIYVMTEAKARGYTPISNEWANLGQGAPETGPLPGSPERLSSVQFGIEDLEYSPIDGLPELRAAVAELYNERYRKGKSSKYTAENVSISSGGRAALTRAVSTLGRTNVGHFLPDYTAYEELLDTFGTFAPIPILLNPERNYEFNSEELREEVLGMGLSTVLLSNPSNPMGKVVYGTELEKWVSLSRELSTTLIFDEFYSHYIYDKEVNYVSAAEYVEDVNSDAIIIIDGLTKNWRYPGFRVSWTLAPKAVIEGIASAGSFIDGGCARPMQIAATKLVNKKTADTEAAAIKKEFTAKRDFMLEQLQSMGIRVIPVPMGGFYCWGDLSGLPSGLNNGMEFFQKALSVGVIIVPGAFFDINPGQRRPDRPSRFASYARFSFGPSMAELERGIRALKTLL